MRDIYLGDWSKEWLKSDIGRETMMRDFNISEETLAGVDIVLASYTFQVYDGEALVIFERDGEMYLVEGAHCSCFDLEGQWDEELINVEFLEHKLNNGRFDSNLEGDEEVKRVIAKYIKEKRGH